MRTPGWWRDVLAGNDRLSPRFIARHARLLARCASACTPEVVAEAARVALDDPRAAERLALGLAVDTGRGGARDVRRVVGSSDFVESLRAWVTAFGDLDRFLLSQPALERTWVPLHPDRKATLVTASPAGPLVAVAWQAHSVEDREQNRDILAGVADTLNAGSAGRLLRVVAPNDYAIVEMSDGDPWVFAPDFGPTVEDSLRANLIGDADRQRLVATLTQLRSAMLDAGVVWQGFAPRNMFMRGADLVLIDFEDCVMVADDPHRSTELLLWHTVFFADCLTSEEREALFADHPQMPSCPDDHQLSADDFERALLDADVIGCLHRKLLLSESAELEGRHRRPTTQRDGGILFGHELGHFWGDFLTSAVEATIFRALSTVADPSARTACLEVFEAAMEADIDGQLLAAAVGDPAAACSRSIALADAMLISGPDAIAAIRHAHDDWYTSLDDDPAHLVDHVLFALHNGMGGDIADYLVGSPTHRAEHTTRITRTVEAGMAFLHADGREDRFLNHADPSHLLKILAEPVPVDGQDFDAVLSDADERILHNSISQAHPGYLAFPDAGNSVAALAGSMLTRLLNQNVIAVDRSAPAATFATIQVIEWLRELVGYEARPITELRGVRDVAGLWTTGGHLSNHIAMLAALGRRFPQARQHGLAASGTRPAVVMAGPIAHYSHSDAAFHLGLGWDAILDVPARPDYTTDPAAVDELLSDPPEGVTPFMVIGVAGNCRTTGLDDLSAIAEVCQRHGVWFHADACHGGSLIFNDRLRDKCLAGIERADSVSLDPHKGLFTPYPSSYVVFRDRGVLNQFSRHAATVEQDGCWDLGLITPFLGSCGFEALPTWMLLKHVGTRRLGALVEARQALVRHLERRLDDTGLFIRLNDVDFYRLTFVFCPPPLRAAIRRLDPAVRQRAIAVVSGFTSRLNTQLYRDGEVCFDEHTLADLDNRVGLGATAKYTIMAACPGNPLTTIEQLDRAVDRLVAAARPLVDAMSESLTLDVHDGPRPLAGPAGWNDQ